MARLFVTLYLDNAATSFPKPDAVCDAAGQALRGKAGSPGRGGYRAALDAAREVFATRLAAARLVGLADPARVVFTANATEALNLALFGVLKPGDRVVTTSMEHNAVLRPLHALAGQGVEVISVAADSSGFVAPAALRRACTPGTRLLAMTHCSNVTGTIQAIEELGPWCRTQGILFLVDAAQSAGSLPLDMAGMAIDLLAVPGHKGLLGPTGTGFLAIAPGVEPRPLLYGGTGSRSSSPEQPEELPDRLESGTLNTVGLAGLHAGLQFLAATGIERIRAGEQALIGQLCAGLAQMPGVRIYGPRDASRCGSVLSLTIDGRDPADIAFRLDRDYDISVRDGLHCAPEAHRTIGTFPQGTVRVSPGCFTSAEDIERLLAAVRSLISA